MGWVDQRLTQVLFSLVLTLALHKSLDYVYNSARTNMTACLLTCLRASYFQSIWKQCLVRHSAAEALHASPSLPRQLEQSSSWQRRNATGTGGTDRLQRTNDPDHRHRPRHHHGHLVSDCVSFLERSILGFRLNSRFNGHVMHLE